MSFSPRANTSIRNFLGIALCLMPWLARGEHATIKDIDLDVSREVDRSRVLSTLPFRSGDAYELGSVEQGLLRLAETGRYQAVESHFDSATGHLLIYLRLYDSLSKLQVTLTGPQANLNDGFLKADILDVVRISPGDPIDIDQLNDIRERVRERLFDRGLRSAKVLTYIEKNTQGEQTLNISVDTAELSYVNRIQFNGMSKNDLSQFYDALYDQKTLRKGVKSHVFDTSSRNEIQVSIPFDWIAFNQAMSAWNLGARENSYYDFKASLQRGAESEGGFTLNLNLNRGPRYNVQFSGNVVYWERDLREKVLDRTKRLGIPFDVRDAAERVSALYKAKGYANVEIESSAKERGGEKIIGFHIKEGKQYFVRNITFEGIPTESQTIVDKALDAWMEPTRSPFHAPYFDEKLIQNRLPLLIKEIRDRGFLQARILEFRPSEPQASRNIDIEIAMQLGPRYTLQSLTVTGNSVLTEKEMDGILNIDIGEPVNPTKIFAAVSKISQRYKELGFIYVKVPEREEDMFHVVPDLSLIDVTIDIQPGPQVFIGQVLVQGQKKTKEHVITRELRELDIKPGKVWNPYAVQAAEQRLLSLGIFGAAKIDPIGGRVVSAGNNQAVEQNERDLKANVAERPPGSVEFGPGYRTDLGVVLFGQFNYRNLGGWNRQVVVKTQVSRKLENYQFLEQNYSITYLEPFIFDDPTRFQITTGYQKTDDIRFKDGVAIEGINYEEESVGTALDRQLGKYFRITQNLYKISLPRVFRTIEARTDLDKEKASNYRIAQTGTLLNFDTRDNIFSPTTGWYTGTSVAVASSKLGGGRDSNFIIGQQVISRYFRAGPKASVALNLSYAHLWTYGSTENIPENVRLALGGRTSVRSLEENQLEDNSLGLLEQQSLLLKVEYRQPLLLDFGVAYFVDAGAVDSLKYNDPNTVRPPICLTSIGHAFSCFTYGVGFGFRLSTPVGPLALDFAFNPSPQAVTNQDSFKIQFNIGSF